MDIKKKIPKFALPVAIAAVVVLCVTLFFPTRGLLVGKETTSIVTSSVLEKMLDTTELSTYKMTYNGVAEVNDPEKDDDVAYYVSYQSTVRAGVDISKIKVEKDTKKKQYIVTLPEIKIFDPNVSIESLDYLFMDSSANTSTVSKDAYKAAIRDAEKEVNANTEIKRLAKENLTNVITAVTKPLLNGDEEDYTLLVK